MRLNAKSVRVISVARVFLATVFLIGFVASSFPLETIASGPTCTLACCAGRAPHAAASCMNGSCHAFLKSRSKRSHQHNGAYSETFCGLTRFSQLNRSLFSVRVQSSAKGEGSAKERDSNSLLLSGGMISSPCDPNCGGVISSASSQTRPRQFIALAYANKPRPPSPSRQCRFAPSRFKTLSGFGKQVSPRGPPVQSS